MAWVAVHGDSANGTKVIQTSYCDHFIEFEEKSGTLTAEAGITLREILKIVVPAGMVFASHTWHKLCITLGGAIASDIHGKNHHIAGTFGQHVKFINIIFKYRRSHKSF